jgi:WD40 repeat protein/tetratricopeptide (TPR) repeat protein
MVRALRLAPSGPESSEFRQMVRRNLATWHRTAPLLRAWVPGNRARFIGTQGKSFVTWAGKVLYRWNAATGEPLGPAAGVSFPLDVVAVSEDGEAVVLGQVVEHSYLLRVVHARTRALLGRPCTMPLGDFATENTTFELCPGKDVLVVRTAGQVGGPRHFFRVWDVATGRVLGEPVPSNPIWYQVVKARDGRRLLLLLVDGAERAEFRDLQTGKRLGSLPELAETDLRLQPSGKTILSVDVDGTVRCLNPADGRVVAQPWRPGKFVRSAALSADGVLLAGICQDQRVRWYDARTRQPCHGTISLRPWHLELGLVLDPVGTSVLVTDPRNCQTQLWQAGSLVRFGSIDAPLPLEAVEDRLPGLPAWAHVAFSPDARTALLAGQNTEVDLRGQRYGRLVDTQTSRPLGRPLRGATAGPERGGAHAFSPDGKLVATCTRGQIDPDAHVRIWDARTGEPRSGPLRYPKLIHALDFSPDSKSLAVGTVGPILLWDVSTGRGRILRQEGPVGALCFSPDGRRLTGATLAGWRRVEAGLQIWDLASGKPRGPLHAVDAGATTPSLTDDGKVVRVLHAHYNRLSRYDPLTGQRLGEQRRYGLPVAVLGQALRGDGLRFATGTFAGRVQQWDTDSGELIGASMEHGSPAVQIVYSGAGDLLAVACKDWTVRVWDAAGCRPVGPPLPHSREVLGMAFTPDGKALITATGDGRMHTWPMSGPVPDDEAVLDGWLQTTTGIKRLAGEVLLLAPDEWTAQRQLLRSRWPEGIRRPEDLGSQHDALAREAQTRGDERCERWHLDRWIEADPADWLAWARRAALSSARGRLDEAAVYYARAAACGGGEALVDWQRHRAVFCLGSGQYAAAKWYLDRLLAQHPGEWRLYADRAEALGKLGRMKERAVDLEVAVRRGADDYFLCGLADEHAGRREWRRALELCRLADRQGDCEPVLVRKALACAHQGDHAGHRQACAALERLTGNPAHPVSVNSLAWFCVLTPAGAADFGRLAERQKRAVGRARDPQEHRAFLNTLGAVLYRAGRHAEAIRCLKDSVGLHKGEGDLSDWVFLAMAHARLGKHDEARRWLAKVRGHRSKARGWAEMEEELLWREAMAVVEAKR